MKKTARKLTLLLGALLVGQTVAAAQVPTKGREGDRRPDNRRGIVPTIPVILDGVKYPAGALPPSNSGRAFVVTPEDQKNGVVHAFSSHEVAKEFMRLQALKSAPVGSSEAVSSCAHPYFYSAFNKVRGGGGSDYIYMDMYPTTGDPEIYFNLEFDGWNNTISWVAAACNGYRTVLFSCRDFELNKTFSCEDPDYLFVSPGMIIPDLMPYGFNNRTSSIKFG
ncbi:MAG TPA: hypothetical protein VHC97_21430 [Thermoanaerobaculia bacterium]|jgi:hypothetical protein|nr:hypothetical protein [Thermoanaerobaculia bacterium]